MYGKKVILADRDYVEKNVEDMLLEAKTKDIAFLVVGDPFGATTHSDLVLRAMEENVPYRIVHNASILNAIGCTGLQLYNFGQTVSIVFFEETWKPESFYDKIKKNLEVGMHTLCLLDIKVKEQTIENMMKGNQVFEPPRFMTIRQALLQILEVAEKRQETMLSKDSLGVGVARVGSANQQIGFGSFEDLMETDFGTPLHSLIIPAKLHEMEISFLTHFKCEKK